MQDFLFSLGAHATIVASGESGTVIGQAHFSTAEDSFLIRYTTGEGRATEQWWTVSALTA